MPTAAADMKFQFFSVRSSAISHVPTAPLSLYISFHSAGSFSQSVGSAKHGSADLFSFMPTGAPAVANLYSCTQTGHGNSNVITVDLGPLVSLISPT